MTQNIHPSYNNMTDTEASSSTTKTTSKTHDENDYYYYNTHATGRIMTCEEGEAIKNAYVDNISDTMTAAVAHVIEAAYNAGLSAEEIVMAIEETGFAPRPSPAYLRAILQNWAENGVTVSKIRHLASANRANPWWK